MKKTCIKSGLIFALLVINHNIYAYDEVFQFDYNDFSIEVYNNFSYIHTDNDNYNYEFGNVGDPIMPYFRIDIPSNYVLIDSALSYEILEQHVIANNVLLQPRMPYVSYDHPNSISELSSYLSSLYPESHVEIFDGPHLSDNGINLYVTPFSYDARTKELSFISSMRISFNENSDTLLVKPTASTGLHGKIDYAIITVDSLANSFVPLRNWKRMKGVRTEIVSLDSIFSRYSQSLSQTDSAGVIKRYIKELYDYNGLEMVLLGGDVDIVPGKRCVLKYYRGNNDTIVSSAVSDMFYGCFDGNLDWNADNDSVYGELDKDSISLKMFIDVTRLPLKNCIHVENYVRKLLKYETDPPAESISNIFLTAGCKLYQIFPDGRSDAHGSTELMYDRKIRASLLSVEKRCFYDTGNDLNRHGDDSIFTNKNFAEVINDCHPSMLHVNTHGISTSWFTSTSSFGANQVNTLTNDDVPCIITTSACRTNGFENRETCLSEAFIRHEAGGAIAYWGSSSEAWGPPSDAPAPMIGPSELMCGSFWGRLSSSENHFGSCISKLRTNSYICSYDRPYDWLRLAMNAIGDCEFQIYTDVPSRFDSAYITINPSKIEIRNSQKCNMAVTSYDDGQTYFKVHYALSNGQFNYAVPSNICLTGINVIPYRIKTGRFVTSSNSNKLYLQNIKFPSSNITYCSSDTEIGYNIDNTYTEGAVVVEPSANVEMEVSGKVLIRNGFYCKKGGIFKVIQVEEL